jgi:hypothetical protein
MKDKYQSLLSDNIFYSPDTLTFYKIGYAGMGNDDVRELPTAVNSYLHSMLCDEAFDYKESWTVGCVGRYRDANEEDENNLEFTGYFVNIIKVATDKKELFNEPTSVNVISLRLAKALLIASKAHSKQRRKSDDSPYVNHLIEVQNLLTTSANGKDEDIIIAGLLHDVIEDSDVTQEQIRDEFGSRIASIVAALTDDKTLPLDKRRELAIKKLETAPKSVKLIKLADICSNAAAIPKGWDIERITSYFDWLDTIVAKCIDVSPELTGRYEELRNSSSTS